jgi:hypothetical protein
MFLCVGKSIIPNSTPGISSIAIIISSKGIRVSWKFQNIIYNLHNTYRLVWATARSREES